MYIIDMEKTYFYSVKIDESKQTEIIKSLSQYKKNNSEQYVNHFFVYKGIEIKIYKSKKGLTLFLKGDKEEINHILSKFDIPLITFINIDTQIGSDEVGTGDFLLPIIVVSAFFKKEDLPILENLGVCDSKKMNDKVIKKIGPTLIKTFNFSKLTLSNEKYNELVNKGENINTIKAKLHNRVLLNLKNKHPECKNIFIDQFVNKKLFYEYIENEPEVIQEVIFKTKGETFYPSVALASVIARYSLLIYKDKLEKKYKIEIPFGASKKVDMIAKEFIKTYGINEFKKIAKLNFNNIHKLF